MSSNVQDELSQLTDKELLLSLVKYDMINVPITSTNREVILKKLREKINAQQPTNQQDAIRIPTAEANGEKIDSNSIQLVLPMQHLDRITHSVNENRTAASIVLPSTENDILKVNEPEVPVPEVHIQPKRTCRSLSLGKIQTLVTSHITAEVAKQIPVVERNEEDYHADDSLWHLFAMLLIALGRHICFILLVLMGVMIVLFAFVFFLMCDWSYVHDLIDNFETLLLMCTSTVALSNF